MGYQSRSGQQPVPASTAEPDGPVPEAQSQVQAHQRPEDVSADAVEDDGSGLAGGSSGSTGGTSGTPGHPDASR